MGWPARRDQLHKHGCLQRSCVAMLWGWDFWVEGRVNVPLGSVWLQCRPRARPADSPGGAGRHPPQGPGRPTAGSAELGSRVLLGKEAAGGGGLGWWPCGLGRSLDLPRVRVQPRSVGGASSGAVGAGPGPARAGLSAGGRAGSPMRRPEAWGSPAQSREVSGRGSHMATWRLPVSISPASRQTTTG